MLKYYVIKTQFFGCPKLAIIYNFRRSTDLFCSNHGFGGLDVLFSDQKPISLLLFSTSVILQGSYPLELVYYNLFNGAP